VYTSPNSKRSFCSSSSSSKYGTQQLSSRVQGAES
jgi:hypothetical protein